MEIEQLQKDMIAAMKAKDKPRKEAISSLVSAVKKAAIDQGCRDDIKENCADILATGSKGEIMKTVMPMLKGKADGKVINQTVAKLTGK